MPDVLTILIPLAILAIGIVSGIPIAFALGIAGTVGVLLVMGMTPTIGTLRSLPHEQSANYTLSTIPMFILMAEFLSNGRLAKHLFAALSEMLRPVRGGLAIAVVGGNVVFGAMSGSSTAAAGLLSRVSIPEMRRYGYSERMSLGSVASAGTLAVMIPPSVGLIIYGIATDTSIGRLFAAGVVPGLVTAAGYTLLVMVWSRVARSAAPASLKFRPKEAGRTFVRALPTGIILTVVFIGLYSGIMTPTEAGAVGASAAFVVSIIFGGLRWKGIIEALKDTVILTAMIMLIIVSAMIFSRFLSVSGISRGVVGWVEGMGLPPFVVLILVVLMYLALGFFMDQIAILLVTLPLTFPLITSLGYDPVWFGIIVLITVEIGLITPPLGMNVLVTHGVAGGKLGDAFTGALMFIGVTVAILVLVMIFPEPIVFFADLIAPRP